MDACGAECPGWAVFNDNEIQRCDECRRFADDEEAIAHVAALEAIDVGLHLEAGAQRALVEVRKQLADIVVEANTNANVSARKLAEKLEVLLGRSLWLERHRWSEHALQFSRLLAELHAIGEVVEDTDLNPEKKPVLPGYFLVKVSELEQSMGQPWVAIMSLFERAEAVFQEDKPEVHK